jgi:hypothetical protein
MRVSVTRVSDEHGRIFEAYVTIEAVSQCSRYVRSSIVVIRLVFAKI